MRLRLHILNTPDIESQRTLAPPGGLVGRSSDSALPLLYESISRQHVELRHDGRHWWLHNLSQTSPTVVDEEPVEVGRPQRLQQRGTLKLGRISFTYEQEALPPMERTSQLAAPLNEAVTLVLPRATVLVPLSALTQAASVRASESPSLEPLPTLVRQPGGVMPPPLPPPTARVASSPTLILQPPSAAAAPAPSAAEPRTIEHQLEPLSIAELVPLEQLEEERARHRRECQRMTAELAQLKQENGALRQAQAVLSGQLHALQNAPPTATHAETAGIKLLQEKALELLLPFSRSLEQAGEALRKEDSVRARALLRSASFALADLRDLFQS